MEWEKMLLGSQDELQESAQATTGTEAEADEEEEGDETSAATTPRCLSGTIEIDDEGAEEDDDWTMAAEEGSGGVEGGDDCEAGEAEGAADMEGAVEEDEEEFAEDAVEAEEAPTVDQEEGESADAVATAAGADGTEEEGEQPDPRVGAEFREALEDLPDSTNDAASAGAAAKTAAKEPAARMRPAAKWGGAGPPAAGGTVAKASATEVARAIIAKRKVEAAKVGGLSPPPQADAAKDDVVKIQVGKRPAAKAAGGSAPSTGSAAKGLAVGKGLGKGKGTTGKGTAAAGGASTSGASSPGTATKGDGKGAKGKLHPVMAAKLAARAAETEAKEADSGKKSPSKTEGLVRQNSESRAAELRAKADAVRRKQQAREAATAAAEVGSGKGNGKAKGASGMDVKAGKGVGAKGVSTKGVAAKGLDAKGKARHVINGDSNVTGSESKVTGKGADVGDGNGKGKGSKLARSASCGKPVRTDSSWSNGSGLGKRQHSEGSFASVEEKSRKKPKQEEPEQVAGVDKEGRRYDLLHVVVNFANVGATFAKRVLDKDKDKGDKLFDWEGVRRCCRHLKSERGMKVVGVIYENFRGPDNGSAQMRTLPSDIVKMCETVEETPRVIGNNHGSADDEMTIKCAYRRNCRFMDNDNYRDWKQQLRDVKCRDWLDAHQDLLHMRYFFDKGLGSFDLLEGNTPARLLVPNQAGKKRSVDKRELWTAAR